MTDILTRLNPRLNAGIDWLTCTAVDPTRAAALLSYGGEIIDEEVAGGAREEHWHWRGFSGRSAGGARYGYSGSRALLQLSGPTARDHGTDAIRSADNISRIDLQATYWEVSREHDHAQDAYRAIASSGKRRGRPLGASLITTLTEGTTAYIGKRISDQFGRVYNRSDRDGSRRSDPEWRWEVELKRGFALTVARQVAAPDVPVELVPALVRRWFADRNISTPFRAGAIAMALGSPRGSADDARRIQWLRQGVRPAVVALAAEHSWPEVMALLGCPVAWIRATPIVTGIATHGD